MFEADRNRQILQSYLNQPGMLQLITACHTVWYRDKTVQVLMWAWERFCVFNIHV